MHMLLPPFYNASFSIIAHINIDVNGYVKSINIYMNVSNDMSRSINNYMNVSNARKICIIKQRE